MYRILTFYQSHDIVFLLAKFCKRRQSGGNGSSPKSRAWFLCGHAPRELALLFVDRWYGLAHQPLHHLDGDRLGHPGPDHDVQRLQVGSRRGLLLHPRAKEILLRPQPARSATRTRRRHDELDTGRRECESKILKILLLSPQLNLGGFLLTKNLQERIAIYSTSLEESMKLANYLVYGTTSLEAAGVTDEHIKCLEEYHEGLRVNFIFISRWQDGERPLDPIFSPQAIIHPPSFYSHRCDSTSRS